MAIDATSAVQDYVSSDLKGYYSDPDFGSNTSYVVSGYTSVAFVSDQEFMNSNTSFVSLNQLKSEVQVTQNDPRKPFDCNFQFNVNFNIDLKLPNLNAPSPNYTLLFKIDQFSLEVSRINDALIKAIKAMNCCDIEEAYNKNLVPFFRYFADHPDAKWCSYDSEKDTGDCTWGGETFPKMLLGIAEDLLKIYLAVRPLACLIRPLPGNPWFPWDFDPFKYIRFIIDYFDMYYDVVISGKIMNIMLDPVISIRKSLENCVLGENYVKNAPELVTDFQLAQQKMQIDAQIKKYNDRIKDIDADIKSQDLEIELVKSKEYQFTISVDFVKENGVILDDFTYDEMIKTVKEMIPLIYDGVSISYPEDIEVFGYELYRASEKDLIRRILDASNPKIIYYDQIYSSLINQIIKYANKLESTFEVSVDIIGYYTLRITTPGEDLFEIPTSQQRFDVRNAYDELDIASFSSKIYQDLNAIYQAYLTKERLIEEQNTLRESVKNLNELVKTLNAEETNYAGIPQIGYFDRWVQTYYGVPSSDLCNCILNNITALLDTVPKIPTHHKIFTLYKKDIEELEGKEAYDITYADLDRSDLKKLFGYISTEEASASNGQLKATSDTANITYTTEAIKQLYEDNDTILTIAMNHIQLNFSENGLTFNISAFAPRKQMFVIDYLQAVDKAVGKETYTLYELTNGEMEVFDPLTGSNVTINIPNFSENYIPSRMYPSEFYIKHQAPLLGFLQSLGGQMDEFKRFLDTKVFGPDHTTFKDYQKNALNLIETIRIWAKYPQVNQTWYKTAIDYTTEVPLINQYLDYAEQLYAAFFSSYKQIDLSVDKTDARITNYANKTHAADDLIRSKFGYTINDLINMYISKRETLISQYLTQLHAFYRLDSLGGEILGYIYDRDGFAALMNVTTWDVLKIPCKCNGLICELIQYIINYLLGLLNKLIQYLVNMVIDWFMKTIIGRIIKVIIAKIRCAMMIVNYQDDKEQLSTLVDSLIEGLKGRIKLYTDPNVCLYSASNDIGTNTTPDDTDITDLITEAITSTADDDTSDVVNTRDDDLINQLIPTVTTDATDDLLGGNAIISIGDPNIPDLLQPEYINQTEGLGAQLVVSDGVTLGPANENGFPLLDFGSGCEECSPEVIDNTKIFIS